ncbi:aldo/keto reductase [Dactylosporangium sp. McL0621]|uniref:aldo/keto reductase n=1 Tax=Dactylosporangium sp. McL0621 TaxID=3415678 RepID=UPI003CFB5574
METIDARGVTQTGARGTAVVRTRILPRGLSVTEVGLGAAQLGNLYRETTEEQAAETVETAWNVGIRYFDTAPHYGLGLSELRLGRLLADRPRRDYVLSTKVGRLLEPNPDPDPGRDAGFAVPATLIRRFDLTRDGIHRSMEESLSRLRTDYVDIAYLHDPDDMEDAALATAFPALVELREQGVVRAIGAGMNYAAPLARFVREADIDVVMVAGRFTLLDRSAQEELLPAALERGVAVVAAGVYNSGILATRRPSDDATYDYHAADATVLRRARLMADQCEQASVELPAAALQFPLRHPAVACVVVGVRGRNQVLSTVDRYNLGVPDDLYDRLDETQR